MADTLAVDMIVQAISKGFEKLNSDISSVAKSGDVATAAMRDRMAFAASMASQKFAELEKTSNAAAESLRSRMATAAALAAQKFEELQRQQQAVADVNLKIAAGFGVAAAAGGALLMSSTQLAARVETLGVVTVQLGKNVGYSKEQIRELEKAVSDEGITLQAARQSIARMIQANIDLSKATELASLAQNAAVIAGTNSSEAFDMLVTSLATGQVRMLHTMGIQVLYEDGYKKLAATLGKTTEELTEVERAQARLDIVLEGGKNIAGAYDAAMDTAGKKVTSLARHIEESRRALGEAWLPLYASAIDAITNSLKVWEGLDQDTKSVISTLLGMGTAIAGANAIIFGLIGTLVKAKIAMAAFNASMITANLSAGVLASTIALPVTAVVALTTAVYLATKAQDEHIKKFKEEEEAARESSETYADYIDMVHEAAKAQGFSMDDGNLVTKRKTGRFTARQRVKSDVTMDATDWINANMTDERTDSVQKFAAALAEGKKRADDFSKSNWPTTMSHQLREDIVMFALSMEHARAVAAGLDAGLKGTFGTAYDGLTTTLDGLTTEQADLTLELEKAQKQGWKPTSDKIKEINGRLAENKAAQDEARAAMEETTAAMIYQQAAAGLDADASLALARSMGILSEQDYAVAVSLQALREKYDENADGLIEGTEGAKNYAGEVSALNDIVQALVDANLPVTLENINKAFDDAKAAADTADEAVGKIPEGIGLIGTESDTAKGKTDELLKTQIPEGAGIAVTAIDLVTAAIARIPSSKTVYINVVSTGNASAGFTTVVNPDAGGANGLSMRVPAGYPNDSFIIGATSGEQVNIATPSQIKQGGAGGASLEINQYFQSAASAAIGMAEVSRLRRDRLGAAMGRG